MSQRKYAVNETQTADLANRFTYHAPFGDQVERYGELRGAGHELAQLVLRNTPPGREQSLALTNLEQAIFWANAAIARHELPKPESNVPA